MSLTDDDRRVLAAVAMGFVQRYYEGSETENFSYFIQGEFVPWIVTSAVRRLMAKQLVAYTNGKLILTHRKIDPD